MTAQIPDTVEYGKDVYAIAGGRGEGLFSPADHGIEPAMISTACWRGFLCRYRIEEEELRLAGLEVGLPDGKPDGIGALPALFGRKAAWAEDRYCAVYEDLGVSVLFTGELLLARDFIEELYVHMGFHPAYKYREVLKVRHDKGRLMEIRDLSKNMANLRKKIGESGEEPAGWEESGWEFLS
jgi:hypothetical protein